MKVSQRKSLIWDQITREKELFMKLNVIKWSNIILLIYISMNSIFIYLFTSFPSSIHYRFRLDEPMTSYNKNDSQKNSMFEMDLIQNQLHTSRWHKRVNGNRRTRFPSWQSSSVKIISFTQHHRLSLCQRKHSMWACLATHTQTHTWPLQTESDASTHSHRSHSYYISAL